MLKRQFDVNRIILYAMLVQNHYSSHVIINAHKNIQIDGLNTIRTRRKSTANEINYDKNSRVCGAQQSAI